MQYDLEDRTLQFAKHVRKYIKALPKTIANREDVVQLIRSSGSVGANYIEAKKSRYWLRLIDTNSSAELDKERDKLIQEATELMNILGAIIRKSSS